MSSAYPGETLARGWPPGEEVPGAAEVQSLATPALALLWSERACFITWEEENRCTPRPEPPTLVVSDPGRVVHLSVGDVASEARTSASTVVRCCQRLGFKGFQHLKTALAQELDAAGGPAAERASEDSPGEILRRVLASSARALTDSLATVDYERFKETVRALSGARKALFVGVGTSAPLAQDAAYRFLTIGVGAEAPPDVHTQHVAAKLLGGGATCVSR